MKDFPSTLFTQLKNSDELENLKQDFYQLHSIIEHGNDMKSFFQMLGYHQIAYSLRKRVEHIVKDYMAELLHGLDMDNLRVFASSSSYSIHLSHDRVPMLEYKPHYWVNPSTDLIRINFSEQTISVYDVKQEYEQAQKHFLGNVKKEKIELQKLEDHLLLMNQRKKSRAFILKEIRQQIWFINKPKYFLFAIGCYVFPSKYKSLRKAMDELINKQEGKIQYQKEKVQKMEARNYLQIYEEYVTTQQQVLQKLTPLQFKIKTVKLESMFEEEMDNE